MLHRIFNGEHFICTYVSCHVSKNTGGELVTLRNCRLAAIAGSRPKFTARERKANHAANRTINLRSSDREHLVKVHSILITKFQNYTVTP